MNIQSKKTIAIIDNTTKQSAFYSQSTKVLTNIKIQSLSLNADFIDTFINK